jgi:sigma-B regulation protein RsbU (phosphoserine phosphatase)
MLGVQAHIECEEQSLQLESGDKLLLYTDGVIDCRNSSGELFGSARLQQYLAAHGREQCSTLVAGLAEELARYSGDPGPSDDLTILAAEVR